MPISFFQACIPFLRCFRTANLRKEMLAISYLVFFLQACISFFRHFRQKRRISVVCPVLAIPSPAWQSRSPPGSQSQKRVSGQGPGWPPKKEAKTSLLETLRVKNHMVFYSGDSFLTRVGQHPPRRLPDTPETLFFLDFPSAGNWLINLVVGVASLISEAIWVALAS